MDNPLPGGYRAAPLSEPYKQAAVDTINAAFSQMNGGSFTTLDEMQSDWQNEEFDCSQDTHLVIAPDGSVAGYIDLWDIALHVRLFSLGYVHPEHTGKGIGAHLLRWSRERGQAKLPMAPADARVVLHQNTSSANQAAADLFTRHGYRLVRQSYRMRIDLVEPPALPRIPDGITIRPIRPGEERAFLQTDREAFRDHWGSTDEPFEEFYKRWQHYMEHDPNHDPSLWFAAFEGEQMVGISLCQPTIQEVPGMGWVGSLGVLRSWRRRGLGQALLLHSFGEFYRRGCRSAGLSVDTGNLTGALGLYERIGMRPWRTNCTYEYELRPGKDYMTQTLSDHPQGEQETQQK